MSKDAFSHIDQRLFTNMGEIVTFVSGKANLVYIPLNILIESPDVPMNVWNTI